MKKFSKLFLSCAAVAAVTAAVATSAMAAANDISAKYTAEAGAKTASLKITANYTADQKTLLIVPSSVTLDKVSADDVVQIDQKASIVDVVLPAEKSESNPDGLEAGNYTVYMGGDGQIHETTFRVGTGADEEFVVGDVNGDGKVKAADANAILWYSVGNKPVEGKTYSTGSNITTATGNVVIGDVNNDGIVKDADANAVLWYSVGNKPVDGKTYATGTTVTGQLAE